MTELGAEQIGIKAEGAFDNLIDEITDRLQTGQTVDLEDYCGRFPEFARRLRKLFPTLRAMADIGHSLGGTRSGASTGPAVEALGDFRIIGEIGRGGMGVVYEAEQLSLERRVALKVLPFAAVLDPKHLQRFKNEALAAAQLNHPHIVDVYGVGCERGVHYYAMRFIEGETLADVIRQLRARDAVTSQGGPAERTAVGTRDQTPPPGTFLTEPSAKTAEYFRSVARAGRNIAEALDHAHQHGIVHRDVKPSNVMLDRDGKAWVTDFGLAHIETGESLTMTGDMLGTLRYMSPEQALGERRLIDHRSDVYSLGATLYELATLQPLFPDTDRKQLLHKIACEDPPRPSKQNPAIPADLETILLKASAKDPLERYATAQELADDLGRFLKDEPIRAKRPTLMQRARKWSRRHQSVVTTGIAAAVMFAVMAAVGIGINSAQVAEQRDLAKQGWDEADRRRLTAEETTRQAKLSLYQARLAQARVGRRSGRVGQRFESLDAIREAVGLARELKLGNSTMMDLRNEAIACLALCDVRLKRQWNRLPSYDELAAFDSDLQHYAQSDPLGNIAVFRVGDGREVVRLVSPEKRFQRVEFSSDGRLLAAHPVGSAKTVVWNWRKQTIVFRSPFSDSSVCAPRFDADGSRIAIARANGAVVVFNLADGTQGAKIETNVSLRDIAISPDGRKLAATSPDSRLVGIWDIGTGMRLNKFAGEPHYVTWHPDGRLLAVSDDAERHVYLRDSESGNVYGILRGHHNLPWGLNFPEIGNVVCTSSWDGTVRLWDPHSGQELIRLDAIGGTLSADGRHLVCRWGRSLQLWQLTRGDVYRTFPRTASEGAVATDLYGHAISADGRWLAIGTSKGVWLYDFAAGKLLAELPMERVITVAFHPNGKWLFIGGFAGVFRCPIEMKNGVLRIGLWTKLASGVCRQLAIDREGRMLVGSLLDKSAIAITLKDPRRAPRVLSHPGCIFVAISPDSRWIATGPKWGKGVRVWDAATGELVTTLLPNDKNSVSFSPDGLWLVTRNREAICFWKTGSWELDRRIDRLGEAGGDFAWSPDGRLIAYSRSPYEVHIEDAATRRKLATLQSPDGLPAHQMAFGPHGGKLLVYSYRPAHIRVWDLRLLRRELKEMGLDWDAPPFPPSARSRAAATRVVVDLGYEEHMRRGKAFLARRQFERAIAEFTRAIESKPSDSSAWARRAKANVTLGRWREALADYSEAIRLNPGDAELSCRRGWVFKQAEQWDAALSDLTKAIDLQPDNPIYRARRAELHAEVERWRLALDDQRAAVRLSREAGSSNSLGTSTSSCTLALLMLANGDFDGYRRTCTTAVDQLARTNSPTAAIPIAWACALAPEAVPDMSRAVSLAKLSFKAPHLRTTSTYVLGAVLFRAGRVQQSIRPLIVAEGKFATKRSRSDLDRLDYVRLFLAMAYQRLGKHEDALRWFRIATTWLDDPSTREQMRRNRRRFPWRRRLTLRLLRAEAAALLNVKDSQPTPDSRPVVAPKPGHN